MRIPGSTAHRRICAGEKRNFLTNLDNIESVFFKENENYRLLLKIDNKFYTIIDDRVYIVNKSNNEIINEIAISGTITRLHFIIVFKLNLLIYATPTNIKKAI